MESAKWLSEMRRPLLLSAALLLAVSLREAASPRPPAMLNSPNAAAYEAALAASLGSLLFTVAALLTPLPPKFPFLFRCLLTLAMWISISSLLLRVYLRGVLYAPPHHSYSAVYWVALPAGFSFVVMLVGLLLDGGGDGDGDGDGDVVAAKG